MNCGEWESETRSFSQEEGSDLHKQGSLVMASGEISCQSFTRIGTWKQSASTGSQEKYNSPLYYASHWETSTGLISDLPDMSTDPSYLYSVCMNSQFHLLSV